MSDEPQLPDRPRLVGGRFRVGVELGRGRTGVVHAGVDETTGQNVAMKRLHPHLAGDPVALEGMAREAGIASRLSHPRVLTVLGMWRDDAEDWLITQRVAGPGLDVACETGLPVPAALALAEDVARALEAAHAAGIVHGDVRPGNVLVGPEGAILYDFGTSALWRSAPGDNLRPGQTAPEVADGQPPTVSSDLYGLGVVLHRALTGTPAWRGPTAWAIVGAQRQGPPKLPVMPRGVAALITALLQPAPVDRPPDARTVRKAIRALRRSPARIPRLGARLAPVRLGGTWVVSGLDPDTRAPVVFADRLGARSADRLARRLREDGWTAEASRVALGPSDIAIATALGGIGLFVIPLLGAALFPWLFLRWRSAGTRPSIPTLLPRATAPLPPVRLPSGSEHLVVGGLLAITTALVMLVSGWFALLPAIPLVLVIMAYAKVSASDPGVSALRARAELASAEARRLLHGPIASLDVGLSLLGELEHVERDWRAGRLPDEDALEHVEALLSRTRQAVAGNAAPSPTDHLAAALRRGDDLT